MQADFYDFCRLLHQDSYLYGPTGEDVIARIFNMIGQERCFRLQKYLQELLGGDVSDREIEQIWNQSPAQMGFEHAADYRLFLNLVCDMAERYTKNQPN